MKQLSHFCSWRWPENADTSSDPFSSRAVNNDYCESAGHGIGRSPTDLNDRKPFPSSLHIFPLKGMGMKRIRYISRIRRMLHREISLNLSCDHWLLIFCISFVCFFFFNRSVRVAYIFCIQNLRFLFPTNI